MRLEMVNRSEDIRIKLTPTIFLDQKYRICDPSIADYNCAIPLAALYVNDEFDIRGLCLPVSTQPYAAATASRALP